MNSITIESGEKSSGQTDVRIKKKTVLKIFVSSHIPVEIPKVDGLFAVQAGSAIASRRFMNMLHDDEGENISAKNKDYCELTVTYWAWKNFVADYYGFFHYRRYLSLENRNRKLPYRFANKTDERFIKKLGLDCAAEFAENWDMVLPYAEDMRVSVEEYYKDAPKHEIADLHLIKEIISQKTPDYVQDAEQYLKGTKQFFANVFIMKREFFDDYCGWLFSILSEFDGKRKTANARADGFLAERLLGIWFTHQVRTKDVKYRFVQRVDILQYFENPLKKRIIYALFPPSGRLRAFVKSIFVKSAGR